MNTQLFKETKQLLREMGYHEKGDKWGSAMELFFDVAAHTWEQGDTPIEWGYRVGLGGNVIEQDAYSYEFLSVLDYDNLIQIGNYLNRLTSILNKAGLSY